MSPNTAKTLQKGTIMKDLSMEALKKAAAAQKKEAKGVTDDPEPAKRKDPGVPLSFDLPPGSSAMLTDLKAARQRSSEDPDDADMERYATAEGLISDLRAHGIEFWTPGASLGEVHYRPASILSDYAKSELERVKSEVYEILREEEEIEAQWEARLASVSEFDPLADRDDAYDEWIEQAEFGELPSHRAWRWLGGSKRTWSRRRRETSATGTTPTSSSTSSSALPRASTSQTSSSATPCGSRATLAVATQGASEATRTARAAIITCARTA